VELQLRAPLLVLETAAVQRRVRPELLQLGGRPAPGREPLLPRLRRLARPLVALVHHLLARRTLAARLGLVLGPARALATRAQRLRLLLLRLARLGDVGRYREI